MKKAKALQEEKAEKERLEKIKTSEKAKRKVPKIE